MYRLTVEKPILEDFHKIAESCEIDVRELGKLACQFLRQNCKPVDESLLGKDFFPIRTLVTIRTDYSNEVLVPDTGKFFTDCTLSTPYDHPFDDTIILAGKKLVDELFDCGDFIHEIIMSTVLQVLGALIIDDQPYVYINVVIDHNLKNNPKFKVRNCHFEKIESIDPTSPLEKELAESLILVRGGNNNV